MFTDVAGQTFFAGDEAELVRQMHESSRAPDPNDQKWMRSVADRAKLSTGATIRHDTPEHFIADLIEAGLLSEHAAN